MAFGKHESIALFYYITGVPHGGLHAVPKDTQHPALVITPCDNGVVDVAINIGEIGKRYYTTSPRMSGKRTNNDVQNWSNRFIQAVYRSLGQIKQLREKALLGMISADEPGDDPQLIPLSTSIAEACDFGTALVGVGLGVKANIEPIENFLCNPITVESIHSQIVDAAKRIVIRFSASVTTDTDDTLVPKNDPPETIALTPDEQAFYDLLSDIPQTGPDIVAALDKQGYRNFDEPKISRMAKRSHLAARGVRHRKGAGYYRVQCLNQPERR